MKKLKTLHLASFDGNIGDNANHYGFYKHLRKNQDFNFEIEKLEIREFYWKQRSFDESFVELVNSYDLLIIGGGNYFELWVDGSPTGTSIAIELQRLRQIKTPILINALGVDPGQGASEGNIIKFRNFLDTLIKRGDFISIRNDGAKKAIIDHVGEQYLEHISWTPDAGFFIDVDEPSAYYKDKKYIAINVAYDMQDVRFRGCDGKLSYQGFLREFKCFMDAFLDRYKGFEIVFVPHIYRDITFINDILNLLDDDVRRRKISVGPLLHGDSSFKEVMSVYAGAQCVLANRFHANICSIGLEVPTIGLVNYRQIQELYNEMDSDNYVDLTKEGYNRALMEKVGMLIMENQSSRKPRVLASMMEHYNANTQKITNWLLEKYRVH